MMRIVSCPRCNQEVRIYKIYTRHRCRHCSKIFRIKNKPIYRKQYHMIPTTGHPNVWVQRLPSKSNFNNGRIWEHVARIPNSGGIIIYLEPEDDEEARKLREMGRKKKEKEIRIDIDGIKVIKGKTDLEWYIKYYIVPEIGSGEYKVVNILPGLGIIRREDELFRGIF